MAEWKAYWALSDWLFYPIWLIVDRSIDWLTDWTINGRLKLTYRFYFSQPLERKFKLENAIERHRSNKVSEIL